MGIVKELQPSVLMIIYGIAPASQEPGCKPAMLGGVIALTC